MIEERVLAAEAAESVVAGLAGVVDGLLGLDLAVLPGGVVVEVLAGVEVQLRRLAGVDHRLLAEVGARGLAGEHGCRDTVALLGWLLRVEPREAARRVRAAGLFGPRRAVSGAVLPAVFPLAAAAIAAGELSAGQAQVIGAEIEALPAVVAGEHGIAVESFLVGQARVFTSRELRILARRLHDTLDPDGRLADDGDRARLRHLSVYPHPDGTVSGSFATDAVTGQALLTYLDATTRPVVDESGAADPRNAPQRRHDALRELLLHRLRSGDLPATGGISTTIVLSMTPAQLTGHGERLVATAHGALIGRDDALRLLGQARLHPVVLDRGRIRHHGPTRRLFTEGQRLALIARDRGCTFPGCSTGPARCQTHHVTPYAHGGPTTLDNATLLCGYHHTHFEQLGWHCTIANGTPQWRPPAWIDPQRTPRHNTMHQPDIHAPDIRGPDLAPV
jgi:hypothetical protein